MVESFTDVNTKAHPGQPGASEPHRPGLNFALPLSTLVDFQSDNDSSNHHFMKRLLCSRHSAEPYAYIMAMSNSHESEKCSVFLI